MIQIKEPDVFIKLGIKDGELICVDWSELMDMFDGMKEKQIKKEVCDYIRFAELFVKSKD